MEKRQDMDAVNTVWKRARVESTLRKISGALVLTALFAILAAFSSWIKFN